MKNRIRFDYDLYLTGEYTLELANGEPVFFDHVEYKTSFSDPDQYPKKDNITKVFFKRFNGEELRFFMTDLENAKNNKYIRPFDVYLIKKGTSVGEIAEAISVLNETYKHAYYVEMDLNEAKHIMRQIKELRKQL